MIANMLAAASAMLWATLPLDNGSTTPGIAPPGRDGQAPAVQMLPPVCAVNMYGCGFTYDPDKGTWRDDQ